MVLSANLFQCRPAQSTSDGFVILRHLCERTSRNCRRKLVLGERERELWASSSQNPNYFQDLLCRLCHNQTQRACHLSFAGLPFAICRSGDFLADDHDVGRSFGGGVVLRTHVVRIVTPIGTLSGLEESCPGIRRHARRTMAG